MTALGGYGAPGQGALLSTVNRNIVWGEDFQTIRQGATYDGTIRDAGNTPTTIIRAGLLLGKIASTGQYIEWDASQASAATGTQNIAGVNEVEFRAQDFNATDSDRVLQRIVRAPVKASQLLIQGTALTSHVDEYLARRQMHAMGFQFDDDPNGLLAGAVPRYIEKVTSYTVVGDDNGTTFTTTTADTTYTLPTIAAGLKFTFVQTADFEMVVASAEGTNMIMGNNASLSSVTFTAASEHIGANVTVEGVYVGTTLKWVPTVNVAPFSTGAQLTLAIA